MRMTKFLDGPAADVVLALRRAPHYLRAVCSPNGNWDALDALDDEPLNDEQIVVYVMVTGPFRTHVQARGRDGGRVCGWYEGGEYRVVGEQPSDDVLRSTPQWRTWVAEQIGFQLNPDGTAKLEEGIEIRNDGQ